MRMVRAQQEVDTRGAWLVVLRTHARQFTFFFSFFHAEGMATGRLSPKGSVAAEASWVLSSTGS